MLSLVLGDVFRVPALTEGRHQVCFLADLGAFEFGTHPLVGEG